MALRLNCFILSDYYFFFLFFKSLHFFKSDVSKISFSLLTFESSQLYCRENFKRLILILATQIILKINQQLGLINALTLTEYIKSIFYESSRIFSRWIFLENLSM